LVKVFLFSFAAVIAAVAGIYALWGGDPDREALLVQTASSGSLTDNGDGSFTLTLDDIRAITWFSDRPERLSGRLGLEDFAAAWQTDDVADDPPNASLEVADASLPVELLDMTYGGTGSSLTYRVRPLEGSGGTVAPADLARERFGPVTLFIDAYPTSVNDQMTD
jgi:hypothetical protein